MGDYSPLSLASSKYRDDLSSLSQEDSMDMEALSPRGQKHSDSEPRYSNGSSGSPAVRTKSGADKENEPPLSQLNPDTPAMSMAEILAKKLYEEDKRKREEEKKRREERKRKREEEENWHKQVLKRIDEEKKKLDDEEVNSHAANRELYQVFNDLQGITHDFNIHFDTPELVVVGMQSDGKSTFIEGLLGFQFNIVESNIGTRRPLILQMINNPQRQEPFCRFRKEQGFTLAAEEDPFEEDPMPVSRLSSELLRRTNQVAGKGDAVSAHPIILRVEYAHCSNLTIYDTPGFRLGGDEKLRTDIASMVKAIMAPPNRLIVCLEQSTVEWANTTSRPLVREVDRELKRTILVNTKFDNRVKELRDKQSAEKYLQGENLPPGKRPFFISMPIRRNLDPETFAKNIKSCHLDDLERLLEIRIDDKLLNQVGFLKAKGTMEKILTEKYHQAIAPTLSQLDAVCRRTEAELVSVQKELASNNMDMLKVKVTKYVQNFIQLVERLLQGSIRGNPDAFGQTLSEERERSGIALWPNSRVDFQFPNADLKLYGGAQYERLLIEFEHIAHSLEFPTVSIHEVAAALGTSKSHNIPVFETAASDIVQIKSRQALQPLLEVVLRRVCYVFRRLFDIATNELKEDHHADYGMVGIYEQFLSELRNVFFSFVDQTEHECFIKLKDDFDTFTNIIDWDLLSGICELKEESMKQSGIPPTPEETKQRVLRMMNSREHMFANLSTEGDLRSRRVDEHIHKHVMTLASRLFSGIRFFFVKYVRNKLNAFLLDPMFQRLGSAMTAHFRQLDDKKYEEIFNLGLSELKERAARLEVQYQHCITNRDRLKELLTKMRKTGKD